VGLWVLNLLARPITPYRFVLFAAMVGAFLVIIAVPALRDFFALDLPDGPALWGTIASAAAGAAVLELGWQARQWRLPPEARTRRWAWHEVRDQIDA
jgi:cation-transporting ATPase E